MKIVDMHCDTIDKLLRLQEKGKPQGLCENTGHLDLHRMQCSNYLLQNFALFVDMKHCDDPWEQVVRLYECYQRELVKNQDILAPVYGYEDITKNEAQGKMSALLTVEEGGVCKGELTKLRSLYDMGVRMMTLTWNYPNEIGFPNCPRELEWEAIHGQAGSQGKAVPVGGFHIAERTHKELPIKSAGLTEKGREFVVEMETLGIIPDVSHLSDAGFYDVLNITKKPFVASHSNARAICGHGRNLTDDMIWKLAERGGVTGLNYYVDFLMDVDASDICESVGVAVGRRNGCKEQNSVIMEMLVRHAKHIVNVGGVEVLGLGSDFDGIPTNEELPGVQSMELLWNALHRGGFSEDALDKIFRGNVLRVYQDIL